MYDTDTDARDGDRAGPVRQTVSDAAGATKEHAGEVVGVAKEQAQQVAGEVKTQARGVVGDARERLGEQARLQNDRLAEGLRRLADDLMGMAAQRRDSPAATVVTRVADGGRQMADYLAEHGPDGVLAEVQDFARRRPGAFLAVAATSGFVVGRLARGTLAATSDQTPPGSAASSATPPTARPPAARPSADGPSTGYAASTAHPDPSTMDAVVFDRPGTPPAGGWAEGGGA